MLFNSVEFIVFFLPVVLVGFYLLLLRDAQRAALLWLLVTSLVFYGVWNPPYLILIAISIGFNYWAGHVVARGERYRKVLLGLAIAANLILLGYYKYANFFISNLSALTGTTGTLEGIILPLGISFYTFTQIAFIVDAYKHRSTRHSLMSYALFVLFFPHLIAGPIVHHWDLVPQLVKRKAASDFWRNFAIGMTCFVMGMFKKVALADAISPYAIRAFGAADSGVALSFFEAWGGALAYTFQLYFDFSGYSDMAIGLGIMFGVNLPVNFYSPYKSVNIIDFWRRWHMTLSQFLRDYLYIPLGGNRKGRSRRYVNLMVTMVLGGLWHGAGWNFILWGALHGSYLVINHGWQAITGHLFPGPRRSSIVGRWAGRLLTFLCVVVAWVFFRATTFNGAVSMLAGMAGLNQILVPASVVSLLKKLTGLGEGLPVATYGLVNFGSMQGFVLIAALAAIAFFFPNTSELVRESPAPGWEEKDSPVRRLTWSPNVAWAAIILVCFAYSLLQLSTISEFLYYQF